MGAEGKHRTVLHADESFRDREDRDSHSDHYWVVAITEDEPGFSIVSRWRTLEGARAQADVYNAHLGLSDDEIRAIRISSLRASIAAEEGE